jgi:hypothetical protein
MPSTDVILLSSLLEKQHSEDYGEMTESEYFEYFVLEQLLKDFDLQEDEILYGQIGGGGDGGIDGFFTFIDRKLLFEDTVLQDFKGKPNIEVIIVQAKSGESFSGAAIDRANTGVEDIFDFSKDIDELKECYSEELRARVKLFQKAYRELIGKHPDLTVRYVYVSKGDTSQIHPDVQNRTGILEQTIARNLPNAVVQTSFVGARELLAESRRLKAYNLPLRIRENFISTESSYVVLVSLKDFFEFVTDDNGELRTYIFDANVRDYQGGVEVNKAIKESLEKDDPTDFWWLNNGITVITSDASIVGKEMHLQDVQIVNGLQTATTIQKYFSDAGLQEGAIQFSKCVLVRIIVTGDQETRDRVIKATNFQTAIAVASFRATDDIQRNIEAFFLHNGFYYDRRKNYYRNIGKPTDKIISISFLAQAIMSVALREPDNARARPSSLIKADDDYARVFNESIPPDLYITCVELMKHVEALLRIDYGDYTQQAKRNARFHIAMVITAKVLGSKDYQATDVKGIDVNSITEEMFIESLDYCIQQIEEYRAKNKVDVNSVVKNREFVLQLLDNIPFD